MAECAEPRGSVPRASCGRGPPPPGQHCGQAAVGLLSPHCTPCLGAPRWALLCWRRGVFMLEREWVNDCAPSSEGPPLPRGLQKAVGMS